MVKLELLSHGGIVCKVSGCNWQAECAQHQSAGLFRGEDGLTPILHVNKVPSTNDIASQEVQVICNRQIDDSWHGAMVMEDRELRHYESQFITAEDQLDKACRRIGKAVLEGWCLHDFLPAQSDTSRASVWVKKPEEEGWQCHKVSHSDDWVNSLLDESGVPQ